MDRSDDFILFYDYVEPASFLLELRLRSLPKPKMGFPVLEPLELRPPPLPLLDPEEEYWRDHWSLMTAEGKRLGVDLSQPWIVPWSRKAHELGFHAREKNCFPEVHDALFRAYLQRGLDIGRVDVLVSLGSGEGLDPAETKAVLDVDRYCRRVEDAREKAESLGVTRVPTLCWRGRRLEGFPDADSFGAFLEGS